MNLKIFQIQRACRERTAEQFDNQILTFLDSAFLSAVIYLRLPGIAHPTRPHTTRLIF
jgi:hypothetical protein